MGDNKNVYERAKALAVDKHAKATQSSSVYERAKALATDEGVAESLGDLSARIGANAEAYNRALANKGYEKAKADTKKMLNESTLGTKPYATSEDVQQEELQGFMENRANEARMRGVQDYLDQTIGTWSEGRVGKAGQELIDSVSKPVVDIKTLTTPYKVGEEAQIEAIDLSYKGLPNTARVEASKIVKDYLAENPHMEANKDMLEGYVANNIYNDTFKWKLENDEQFFADAYEATTGKSYAEYKREVDNEARAKLQSMKRELEAMNEVLKKKRDENRTNVGQSRSAFSAAWSDLKNAFGGNIEEIENLIDGIDNVLEGSFSSGFDKGFDFDRMATVGLSGVFTEGEMANALMKANNGEPLTEEEENYVRIHQYAQELDQLKKVREKYAEQMYDKFLGFNVNSIGEGIGTSVEMMPAFAGGMTATGMIGKFAKLGGKAVLKSALKAGGKDLFKYGVKTVGKLGYNYGLAKARGLVVAPIMPSTYNTYLESLNSAYSFDDNGNLTYKPVDNTQAYFGAVFSTANEISSEYLGIGIGKVVGLGARGLGHMVANTRLAEVAVDAGSKVRKYLPKLTPQAKVAMRTLGVQADPVSETLSEALGDIMTSYEQSMIGMDVDMSQYGTLDYWMTLAGTTLVYGGSMAALGATKSYIDVKNAVKQRDKILGEISNRNLYNTLLAASTTDDVVMASSALADFDWEGNGIAPKDNDFKLARAFRVADLNVKIMEGMVGEEARLESFRGTIEGVRDIVYQGKAGEYSDMIFEAEVDGKKVYVINGFEKNSNTGQRIVYDPATGEKTSVDASKVKLTREISVDDYIDEAYTNAFSLEMEKERIADIKEKALQMDNPTEKDVQRVASTMSIALPKVGNTVMLANGNMGEVTEVLSPAEFVVRDVAGATYKVHFTDILSTDKLTATAQGAMARGEASTAISPANEAAVSTETAEAAEATPEVNDENGIAMGAEVTIDGRVGKVRARTQDGRYAVAFEAESGNYEDAEIEFFTGEELASLMGITPAPTAEASAEASQTAETTTEVATTEDDRVDVEQLSAEEAAKVLIQRAGNIEEAIAQVKQVIEAVTEERKKAAKAEKKTSLNDIGTKSAELQALDARLEFFGEVLEVLEAMLAEQQKQTMEAAQRVAEKAGVAAETTTPSEGSTTTEGKQGAKPTVGLIRNGAEMKFTDKVIEMVDFVAKRLGLTVEFVDDLKNEAGQKINGDIKGKHVRLSTSGSRGIKFITGHEFFHRMKDLVDEKAYNDFVESIKAFIGEKEWKAAMAHQRAVYRAHNARVAKDAMKEMNVEEVAKIAALLNVGIEGLSQDDAKAVVANAAAKLADNGDATAYNVFPQMLKYSDTLMTEECAADIAGELVTNTRVFSDFVENNKSNYALVRGFRKAIRAMREFFDSFGYTEQQRKLKALDKMLEATLKEAVANEAKGEKKPVAERGQSRKSLPTEEEMVSAERLEEQGVITSMTEALAQTEPSIRYSISTEETLQEKMRKYAYTKEGLLADWTPDKVEGIIEETNALITALDAALRGNSFYDAFADRQPTIRTDWRDGQVKPIVTWTRANVEYKYDMSADLLCINNDGIESVLSSPSMVALMNMLTPTQVKDKNKVYDIRMTASDYTLLYDILKNMGYVVPCKGCFDAAGRFKMLPSVAQKFVQDVNAAVDERNKNPKKFDAAVRKAKGKNTAVSEDDIPVTGTTKDEAIRVAVAGDKLTHHLNWYDFITAEGQTNMLTNYGGVFRAWQKTGAGRPKDKLLAEPYIGDITSSTTTIIGAYGDKTPSFRAIEVNQGTGLRRNSHSEFRPVLAVDEIQFMRDAFLRGLTVFKYMKELDDVRLFGNMGVKFNMSYFPAFIKGAKVAGLDANGNYAASEESVGAREFEYTTEDGVTHYDGEKGLEEAQKYVNENVSLSSVIFSIPHLIKALADVPTPSNKEGIWGSLIPFHSSGATTAQLAAQGLGMARANGVGHDFDEAMTDYDKGVTNFEAVQNDRFGEGWTIVEGKKKGSAVETGHKLEFVNGTHYYNEARGVHLFTSGYILDSELTAKEHEALLGESKTTKKLVTAEHMHKFEVDYNDKVREIGTPYAYKEAADFYLGKLNELGLIPRFDFVVDEQTFLQMCEDANVDPRHPKLGWKGEGNGWSPADAESYYSLFCDYGMTNPATGEWSPHLPVGYINENGERVFKMPDKTIEIVKNGLDRYTKTRTTEEAMNEAAVQAFADAMVEQGRLTEEQVAEAMSQPKFSLIGEVGAEALDRAEEATTRLDDLNIARQMEERGDSALDIRMATGWERGADGLWRYELEDYVTPKTFTNLTGKGKEKILAERNAERKVLEERLQVLEYIMTREYTPNMYFEGYSSNSQLMPLLKRQQAIADEYKGDKERMQKDFEEGMSRLYKLYSYGDNTFMLEEVIGKDHEIFKAYPELKDVSVEIEKNNGQDYGGNYNHKTKRIRIVDYKDRGKYEAGAIVHEIQHAIQYIEGFTSGINPKAELPLTEEQKKSLEVIREMTSFVDLYKDNLADAIEESVEYGNPIWDNLSQHAKTMLKYFGRRMRDGKTIDFVYESLKNMHESASINIVGEDRYHRQAGEVEARNVSARINLSAEERRATLLSETEDVAREDQIFLRESVMQGQPKFSLITPEMDASYLDAVERGDMTTAQRMVMEAAEKAGYINDESWRMNHRAPRKDEENANPFNTEKIVPEDFWEHPEWYTDIRHSSETRESYYAMKSAIDKYKRLMAEGKTEEAENVTITMYRGVDKTANKREASFRNGDWITPSRSYALSSAPYGKARVISQEVKLKDIWWDGNSINEWGYDDEANYGYRDTKNNRKLLDPVTYDDNGNVIPLSERFNPRKEDIRYSLIGEIGAANIEDYGRYGSPMFNLEMARELEAMGKSAKKIRVATNWERGADGKWRYEIMDGTYNHPTDDDVVGKTYALKDILDNDYLFEAYPDLADMTVVYDPNIDGWGSYDGERITLNPSLTNEEIASTLLHEVQHAIQHREMFARGGNLSMMEERIAKEVEKLQQEIDALGEEFQNTSNIHLLRKAYLLYQGLRRLAKQDKLEGSEYEAYRRLAGEVEARNVQKRMGMSEEERLETMLEATEDVARKDQEIIFREAGVAADAQEGTRYMLPDPDPSEVFYDEMPIFDEQGNEIDFNSLTPEEAKEILDGKVRQMLEAEYEHNVSTIRKEAEEARQAVKEVYRAEKEKRRKGEKAARTNAARIDEIFGDTPFESLPYEVQALILIATGEAKIYWGDKGSKRGLASELGLKGSTGDRHAYRNIWGGAKKSFDEVVHSWWESIGGYESGVDTNDLRNALISALQSVQSSKDAMQEIINKYDDLATDRDNALAEIDRNEEKELHEAKSAYEQHLAAFELAEGEERAAYHDRAAQFFGNQSLSRVEDILEDLAGEIERNKRKIERLKAENKDVYGTLAEGINKSKEIVLRALERLRMFAGMEEVDLNDVARLINLVKAARSQRQMNNLSAQATALVQRVSIKKAKTNLMRLLSLKLSNTDIIHKMLKESDTWTKEEREAILKHLWKVSRNGLRVSKAVHNDTKEIFDALAEQVKAFKEETKNMKGTDLAAKIQSKLAELEKELHPEVEYDGEGNVQDNANLPTDFNAENKHLSKYIFKSYLEMAAKEAAYQEASATLREKINNGENTAEANADVVVTRENYLHALTEFNSTLEHLIVKGKDELRDWNVQKEKHEIEIRSMGIRAIGGRKASDQGIIAKVPQKAMAGINKSINSSYWTFETVCEAIDHNAPYKQGEFYTYFMNKERAANSDAITRITKHYEEMARVLRECFPKKVKGVAFKRNPYELYLAIMREAQHTPLGTLSYKEMDENGKLRDALLELNIANAMYTIAMWRQPRYQKVLEEKYQITQQNIDELMRRIASVDAGFLDFMDWVNEKFLPSTRLEYDVVYRKMNGGSMPKEINYFPARVEGHKEANFDNDGRAVISSTPSAIKDRTSTYVAPKLRTDYFKVLESHIQDMDKWAAFAELTSDLQTLLSSDEFRRRCNEYMPGLAGDGSGEGGLYMRLYDTARIVTDNYKSIGGNAAAFLQKEWAQSNIAFRLWTAVKQISSVSVGAVGLVEKWYFVKSLTRPRTTLKRAMELSPSFRQRWKSRSAGLEALSREIKGDDFTKIKGVADTMWESLSDFKDWAMRLGMTPNAMVDAFACAIIFNSTYEQEIRSATRGKREATEQEKLNAIFKAEIAFNTTQQSNEGAYIAPVQADPAFFMFTTYMNNSYALYRKMAGGAVELTKLANPFGEYRKNIVAEYGKKAAWLSAYDAYKDIGRGLVGVISFSFMPVTLAMAMTWITRWIFDGYDDDDDAIVMAKRDFVDSILPSLLQGFTFGNMVANEMQGYESSLTPAWDEAYRDIRNIFDDKGHWWVEIGMFMSKYGLGVDSKALYNICAGIGAMSEGEDRVAAFLNFLNAPNKYVKAFVGDRKDGETMEEYQTRIVRHYTVLENVEYEDTHNDKGDFIGDGYYTNFVPANRFDNTQKEYEAAYAKDIIYSNGGSDVYKKYMKTNEDHAKICELLGWSTTAKPSEEKRYVSDMHAELAQYQADVAYYTKRRINWIGSEDGYYDLLMDEQKAKNDLINNYYEYIKQAGIGAY